MASIIRIKRSSGTAKPSSLNWGEMAYVTGVGQYGGTNQYKDRIFLGDDGTNVNPVAGHYYTSMMEHTPGALNGVTNSRNSDGGIVAILDNSRKIDVWNVDNLTLDANTFSSTNTDGDIIINPNGTGQIMIPDDVKLGFGGGANGTAAPDAEIEWDNSNTRINFNGSIIHFNNTTQSINKDTGASVFEGGVGIEKNLNVGGDLTVGGASTFTNPVEFFDGIVVDSVGISSNVIRTRSGSGNKLYIDPYPDGLSNEGQVIIKGDLQVDGTTTTVNSTSSTLNDGIMKLGDVTSVRTVKTTVGTGVSAIIIDSIVGVNTGDVITGSSSLPGAGTTSIHSFSSQAGISTIFINGVTTAGIVTTTELTITHAYDTNTDRGISFNYNTSSGTGNNKIGFFGYNDSTGENSQAPVRSFTYIPDATVSNEVVTGTRGNLDIKGIYYQAGDFSTHGIVYFDSTGLQNSTTAPSAATFTSTQLLTAVTEIVLTLPSSHSVTAGDLATQAGGGTQQGVVKTSSSGTSVTLIGVTGTFNTSADLIINGAGTGKTPSNVSTTYTSKPIWTTTIDGGTF